MKKNGYLSEGILSVYSLLLQCADVVVLSTSTLASQVIIFISLAASWECRFYVGRADSDETFDDALAFLFLVGWLVVDNAASAFVQFVLLCTNLHDKRVARISPCGEQQPFLL